MTDFPKNKYADETFSKIKKSFEYHYTHCESYRNYCQHGYEEFTPEDLNQFEDLYKIPQISTAIFKTLDVCSTDKDSCKCCKSSGTKGTVSKIYRDKQTVQAFQNSIVEQANLMYGLTTDNCVIYNLGPSEEEAGDIWIAYVMGFLKNVYESYNFMHGGVLESDKLIDAVKNHTSKKRIVLLGAPALFIRVFEFMETKGIHLSLPDDALFLTAGGWKSRTGDTMSREALNELITKYFGIGESQIFDIYNQVESNTLFFECRYHHKHIPTDFLMIIRDPRTLEKLDDGQEGLVTFLDPGSNSYPAFVMTDDIGYVTEGCECGFKGQIFHYVRRVKTVETKGCAMKLDQNLKAESE